MSEEFTEETGFDGYEPVSVDPGPSVLIATIIFCVLSLATLPCLMTLRRQCARRKGENDESGTDNNSVEAKRTNENQAEVASRATPTPRLISDVASVDSSSDSASVASSVWKAILDANPRAGPHTRRGRAHMNKYHQRQLLQDPSSSEFTTANEPFPAAAAAANNNNNNINNTGSGDGKSVGESSSSVLSKLDHDEVSIRDAIDAASVATGKVTKDAGVENNGGDDDETGCWSTIARAYHKLLEIAEYDYEMKRLCRLATPFIIRELGRGVLEAVNVAIIGRFIGTSEVAAYVTVDMMVGLSASIFSGFHESLTTLCSQAIGARNKKLAGQYLQIAMVLYVICFTPMIVFWMIYMDETLRWFGFDEYTVQVGTDFARIYVFVQLIAAVDESLYCLLDTIGKESYSGMFATLTEATSTAGVIAVAFNPDASLERVGLVFLFVAAGSLFFNVLIIMWKGWFDAFLGGIVGSFALTNGKALKLLFKTAASLSLGFLLSYSEWEFLALTAKTLGPAEVAAWGLLGTLWDIVEMVSEAVADAAEVRCAMLLGSGRPERAKLSTYKSIYLATFISLFISACVFIVGDDLPTWMTKDATLQRILSDLIPLFGIGNIALTIGTISWTCVGSQGRYRLATAVGFMGSWFVTMPLAVLTTVVLDLDLQGQTAAVVVGYMVSGTVNAYLLFSSDWGKLSRQVMEANAEVSSDSSSSSSSAEEVTTREGRTDVNRGSLLVDRTAQVRQPDEVDDKGSLYGMDVQIEK